MTRPRLFACLVVLTLLLAPAAPVSPQPEEEHQDTCDRCSASLCGCRQAPAGCTLSASCSCPSSGDCTVTCTYQCS